MGATTTPCVQCVRASPWIEINLSHPRRAHFVTMREGNVNGGAAHCTLEKERPDVVRSSLSAFVTCVLLCGCFAAVVVFTYLLHSGAEVCAGSEKRDQRNALRSSRCKQSMNIKCANLNISYVRLWTVCACFVCCVCVGWAGIIVERLCKWPFKLRPIVMSRGSFLWSVCIARHTRLWRMTLFTAVRFNEFSCDNFNI